ncbi:MAG: sulfatase-like hydrolase/transferase [Verrucomicrobiales bacterium]
MKILPPLLFLALAFSLSAQGEAPSRPNLVVVMVDDMGYAGLGCFGNPHFETPELDRLAAEGMRLTDFHSSGTVCSPTRAGLLTGRYQQRAGIEAVIHPVSDHPEHRKGLKPSETTFAEVLQEAGYTTGLVGKWHQGYPKNSDEFHPQVHGFDEFVGFHSGNIDFVSHVGDHYEHDWWHGREETEEEGYSTHLINRHTLDFVRRHAEEPFCLYVAHEAIHNPVQVPGDPVRRTEDGWDRWKWQEHSEEERIEKYKGMTLPLDEAVGDLRRLLVELGIDKNTLVLFFSDNGAAADFPSGSPELRGDKGSVHEGGHKVPAIAWWPGKIEAGSESDAALISLDVMPTLLALANAPDPERPLDGVDISPLLLNGEPPAARPLFWASLNNGGARSEAMREEDWKLVVTHPKAAPGTFENETTALYHLADDPSEETDLSDEHPERTAAMLAELEAWYADTQETATPQPGGWLAVEEEPEQTVYLIGNSLTQDTIPTRLDGDVQWHIGCGKSLPYLFENPGMPCVKTSTVWPEALANKQYDIVSVQSHYGATLEEDAAVISEWMSMQPEAVFVVHTGWARSESRAEEWAADEAGGKMTHSVAYIEALVDKLKALHPDREIRRTRAMDLLARASARIEAGDAPVDDLTELYRDAIHMDHATGRYLMHNAMRHALGQPRSAAGFEKITPEMKAFLDEVLDSLDKP